MLKLRKSRSFKAVAMFLAILILHTSCSPDNMPQPNECPPVDLSYVDNAQVAEQFERMMEYATTIDRQEDFTTFAEYYETLYGESDKATEYIDTFEAESRKYGNLGFEGYVNDSEYISNDLKAYVTNYAQELDLFLTNQQPDLAEFTIFMNSEIDQVASSNLCDGDQDIMRLYLASSQGYANWFYNNIPQTTDLGSVQLRGCNWYQAILCGLTALIVGGVVFVVVGAVVLIATVFFDGREVTGGEKESLAVLAGFALGIHVGINVYEWCCRMFDEDDQECRPPTGSSYIAVDCNQFSYRVFGPSYYGTTQWDNVNTNPASTITPFPVIGINIPDYGEISEIAATIACVQNAETVHIYSWDDALTFESGESYFPLAWNSQPPFSYNFGGDGIGIEGDYDDANIIHASLLTPNTNELTYSWHVNFPHEIIGGGNADDNWVTIRITTDNPNLTTGVTVTNTCTGESNSLSQTTLIQ